MKISQSIATSLAMLTVAGAGLASCPGGVDAVWNPNEGKCVSGTLTNYCQDTELTSDAGCNGPNQPYLCFVSSTARKRNKQIYSPKYTGQCTLDQTTNPCVNTTAPPIDQIPYHLIMGSGISC